MPTMSSPQSIFIAVVGVGGVGKAFLNQLKHIQQRLQKANPPLDLELVLVQRSKQQLWSQDYAAIEPDVSSIMKQMESLVASGSSISGQVLYLW